MSIFSEVKCQLPSNEQGQIIATSNTAVNPLLAIATNTRVLFYNDSGEKLDIEISRGIMPTALAWHPHYSVLAIGWQNGLITLWNGENNTTKEDANVHHTSVITITYNPNGHRMVTCDDKGTVAVWRNLSVMSVYSRVGAITHCIFCDLQLDKDKEAENKEENKKDDKKDPAKDKPKKSQNLFFFGGKAGIVCVADDSNHVTEVCKVSGAVKSLFFFEKMNSMIIITSTFLLVQFKISLNEKSQHDKKVKLSTTGDAEQLSSIWVGGSLVATVCAENLLRAWHLDKDENYVLTLSEAEESNKGESLMHDKILCITYDERNKLLITGTKSGCGVFWKNMLPGSDSPWENEQWKVLPLIRLGTDPVTQVSVGKGSSMIAFKYGSGISIIYETQIRGRMMDNVKALQTSSKNVQLNLKADYGTQVFGHKSNINIRWIDCSAKHILLWNGKKAEVHEIIPDIKNPKTQSISEFATEKTINIWIFKEHIFLCQNYGIVITDLKGSPKKDTTFSDSEGVLRGSNRNSNFLVIFTSNNYMRVFDLSRREIKQVGVTRKFEDSKGPLGENILCNINCDGTKVSIIAQVKKPTGNESVFYIYDIEVDSFTQYKFEEGKVPIDTYWDQSDKRFLAVMVENSKKKPADEVLKDDVQTTKELFTFFVSSEHGIRKQDSYPLEPEIEGVCALAVPYLNFIVRKPEGYAIQEKPLKDFAGLSKIDDYHKKAIMNFGFYLSIGNMDEAYKSVKQIQDPLVWENMAQMCVKTKRLDVAETCLGNMRFARGAKLVRESKTLDAVEPQLAMLAIQLNMKEEARKLYEECKRYDLLNNMYQATGEWDKAIQVAENHDRISMKMTYYKMAKQFEISKDFEKAIEYYERSQTHQKEVPRMLMNAGEFQLLEKYVESSRDKPLYKWWAQYQESQGHIEDALKFYKEAEDYASMVRIYIVRGDMSKANETCDESNDPLACYHLAKQCEAKRQFSDAIHLYAKAQQVSIAIKLAMENGLDNEIMSLTNTGPKQVMLKAATYFESKGYNEKAIILYIKGRNFKKALDLSIKFNLNEYINRITGEVGPDADPEVLIAVAENFLERNQPDKAVSLLVAAGQYQKAMDLSLQHGIPLSADVIDKVAPKKDNSGPVDDKKRTDILRVAAKNAKKQGNFEMASDLYMQIGENIKAAKALTKLGNTEKLVTFANNARSPEIYIIAANYLQTSDWHNDPNLMKQIINFYSKAKSYIHLAGFYDGCSALEIDKYRDYEKAGAALREALKWAQKANPPERDQKTQELQQKLFLIEKFVEAKHTGETNPQEMIRVCENLLENPSIEYAIRAGDVYATMVEHYVGVRDAQSAYSVIKKMQSRGIGLNLYLDQELLEDVFKAVGVNPSDMVSRTRGQQQQPQFQEEDIEEIPENF